MEGVSSEAASLAGHLKLGNLIVVCFYFEYKVEPTSRLVPPRFMMTTVSQAFLSLLEGSH